MREVAYGRGPAGKLTVERKSLAQLDDDDGERADGHPVRHPAQRCDLVVGRELDALAVQLYVARVGRVPGHNACFLRVVMFLVGAARTWVVEEGGLGFAFCDRCVGGACCGHGWDAWGDGR